MSDAVSTSAGAGTSAQSGQAQTGGANPSTNGGAPSPASGETQAQAGATGAETAEAQKERILAEQDLDAYIEQKINGKVERIKVRDALKGYGMDKTANQRMQEAAQVQKRNQQLNHLFNTDFDKWCEVTGTDKQQFLRKHLSSHKDIAEEILAAEYERQQMDPHQREALELKEKLSTFEQREMQRKQPLINEIRKIVPESQLPKGLEQATPEQLGNYLKVQQQQFQAGIDNLSNELLGAWQEVGLPKQKEFGQWMAQIMSDHQKRTGEALHPREAAVKVKSRFLNSTKSLLSQMDAKAIHETLGEDVIKKLREYDIEQVRSSGPQFGKVDSPAQAAASEQPRQFNQLEWRKSVGLA